jgi:hypothetical protein
VRPSDQTFAIHLDRLTAEAFGRLKVSQADVTSLVSRLYSARLVLGPR